MKKETYFWEGVLCMCVICFGMGVCATMVFLGDTSSQKPALHSVGVCKDYGDSSEALADCYNLASDRGILLSECWETVNEYGDAYYDLLDKFNYECNPTTTTTLTLPLSCPQECLIIWSSDEGYCQEHCRQVANGEKITCVITDGLIVREC